MAEGATFFADASPRQGGGGTPAQRQEGQQSLDGCAASPTAASLASPPSPCWASPRGGGSTRRHGPASPLPTPLASPKSVKIMTSAGPTPPRSPRRAPRRPGAARAAAASPEWRAVLGLEGDDAPIVVQTPLSARLASSRRHANTGSMASLWSANSTTVGSRSFGAPSAAASVGGSGAGGANGSVEVIWQRQRQLASEDEAEVELPREVVPYHGWQRAEWVLGNFGDSRYSTDLLYCGREVSKGQYLNSPSFKALGEEGFLRFWPNGFYNKTQVPRVFQDAQSNRGGYRKSCWCAIALMMPVGTHLRIRFFVNGARSDVREVYWDGPAMMRQLWMVEGKRPEDLSELCVGVEVLKNYRQLRPHESVPRGALRRPVCRLLAGAGALGAATEDLMRGALPGGKGGDLAKLPSPRFGILLPRL